MIFLKFIFIWGRRKTEFENEKNVLIQFNPPVTCPYRIPWET